MAVQWRNGNAADVSSCRCDKGAEPKSIWHAVIIMNTLRENGTGWLIGVGVLTHVIFLGLMLAHVEPFHTFFYLFAWWTYLPVIGAVNYRKSGRSYVIGGWWNLVGLCGCSLIVWLFFEIWNFRLGNWLYVGVITDLGLR